MTTDCSEFGVGHIAFSAGSDEIDISKATIVSPENVLHISLLKIFPELQILLKGKPPVLANFYPSYFGSVVFALNVECTMRFVNAIKAFELAQVRGSPFILCGQPLAVAQFAHMVKQRAAKLSVVVLMLGGYACPFSLERYMISALSSCEAIHIIHAYGSIETAFAVMAGKRSDEGEVIFHIARPDWTVVQACGRLALRNLATGSVVTIDDHIQLAGDGFAITPAVERLGESERDYLNSRDESWWDRHTGHISRSVTSGDFHSQLRIGLLPADKLEHQFGEFIDLFGMDWADKPRWGERTP